MKKYLSAGLFLLSVVVLLTACPYTSDVPISEANEKLDKQLYGKWIKESDKDSENPEFFSITQAEKYKYRIEKNEYSSSDSSYEATVYISHTSTLGDYIFINMQENGEGEFYLYRIDMEDDAFTLFEVTDNIDEKYTNSTDLRTFVDKNKDLSFFYNKDEVKYIRE